MIRTALIPSDPTTGSASARNGPTLPRARNMTCDETACTSVGARCLGHDVEGGCLEQDELRTEVQRGIG